MNFFHWDLFRIIRDMLVHVDVVVVVLDVRVRGVVLLDGVLLSCRCRSLRSLYWSFVIVLRNMMSFLRIRGIFRSWRAILRCLTRSLWGLRVVVLAVVDIVILVVVHGVDVGDFFEEVVHVPLGQVMIVELLDWCVLSFPLGARRG